MVEEIPKPSPPSAAGAWDATQWYEVQNGDSLSKIAQKFYGDASLHPRIFEANRDSISDPNRIRIGQKIRIP
jgi:nucleoid-associated protein YgaU